MSQIEIPETDYGEIKSVSEFLKLIAAWRLSKHIPATGYHSHAWFRGHSRRIYKLAPGVYREKFATRAESVYGENPEEKRLNLEREMLMEFRTAGAGLIGSDDVVVFYLLAQHYGMPTRLLDWTSNPLAALFFAVCEEGVTEDGEVFVMQPTKMFPDPKSGSNEPKPYMRTMRHPQIRDIIGMSFWQEPSNDIVKKHPHILAFRPDNVPGRIGQQSSCFTIHAHLSKPHNNPTLARMRIVGGDVKKTVREELRQLNINEFTVYNDLDHLSKEMRRAWEL